MKKIIGIILISLGGYIFYRKKKDEDWKSF